MQSTAGILKVFSQSDPQNPNQKSPPAKKGKDKEKNQWPSPEPDVIIHRAQDNPFAVTYSGAGKLV